MSIYDNPKLKKHGKKTAGGEGQGSVGVAKGEMGMAKGEGSVGVAKGEGERSNHRRHRGTMKSEMMSSLHEQILVFVGQEWKDLAAEVRILAGF